MAKPDVVTRIVDYIERTEQLRTAHGGTSNMVDRFWGQAAWDPITYNSHYWLWKTMEREGYTVEEITQAWKQVQTYLLLTWGGVV